jgi:hypothetical protein
MSFAAALHDSLRFRRRQVPLELTNGETLEQVLSKHLVAVEALADGDLITSILLLGADGKQLFHAAAPRLPQAYRDAIDGSQIGPCAGSCGTAAYERRPVYVSDIATDPLWENYRSIALPHGLRSCWSTPICAPGGSVIGTFAIYRPTIGTPAADEIEAIKMITDHVAHAVILARTVQDLEPARSIRNTDRPGPKLVRGGRIDLESASDRRRRLRELASNLESKIPDLQHFADCADCKEDAETFRTAADLTGKLARAIRRQLAALDGKAV